MQDRIYEALRRDATDEAVSLAREWAAAEPGSADAQHALAVALAQTTAFDEALRAIDQATALAPDRADLHLLRAALLTRTRQLDDAQAAFAVSLGLDPNQFPAYLAKARLALVTGNLDEAESLTRTAARIAPLDPRLVLIDATIALQRGEVDQALALAVSIGETLGDDPQLLSVLAAAYLSKQHWAFAEQAFRRLSSVAPDPRTVQPTIAYLVHLQGRPGEAADLLRPLLGTADMHGLVLQRSMAFYEMAAGRGTEALGHLRKVLEITPDDQHALQVLLDAWRARDDREDAVATLEALLAIHPQVSSLWTARTLLETPGSTAADEVIARWEAAMPEHVPALEAALLARSHAGDPDGMEVVARRIVALEPGRLSAEQVLVERGLAGDPDRMLARVDELAALQAGEPVELRGWKGWLQDQCGRTTDAIATWRSVHAEQAPRRLPLPAFRAPADGWAEPAAVPGPTRTILVWGVPGSGIEKVVDLLGRAGASVLADRFGPDAPRDPLQFADTAQQLQDGTLTADTLGERWRTALRFRGAPGEHVIDWLPWWDNALVPALRTQLPEGRLLSAVRDPRDMLLDWLSAGSPLPLAFPSPVDAAAWLAQALRQLVDLEAKNAYPSTILRLDESLHDPALLAVQIGGVLGIELPAPPPLHGQRRLSAGRWRAYTAELGEAFALLTPVAVRLGYPET